MQKNRIKPETRVLARDGLFVVLDRLDLVRRLAGRVELVTQPLPSKAPRQLQADHPLTEAQHLAYLDNADRSTEKLSWAVTR